MGRAEPTEVVAIGGEKEKKHNFEDKHLSQIDGIPKDPQKGKPFSRWEILRPIRRSMASLSTDDQ